MNIAIFASGSGSNAENIIRYFSSSQLYHFYVFCNNPKAFVIERAKRTDTPCYIFPRKDFFNAENTPLLLREKNIDFIVLAGFLQKIPDEILALYPRKIINIHPSLLPKFGGKGMYGHHVHEAVKAAGETRSGITIHYVNEVYDSGTIIFQAQCDITPNETPDDIAKKVHILEMEHYPKVTEKLLKDLNTL